MTDKNFFEQVKETVSELGGQSEVYLENANIDCKPQNEYVSEKTVSKIDDILYEGEKVHFLAREGLDGSFAGLKAPVIIRTNGKKEKKRNDKGRVRLAATDRRVVCKIPKTFGNAEQISIPYHSISTVNFKSGVTQTRMSIQTSSESYSIDIGHLENDVCERMVRFIREMVSRFHQQSAPRSNSYSDPLDRIERLQKLKEEGVISEEEFDEKKKQLLDQI